MSLQQLIQLSRANRVLDLENSIANNGVQGDFEGSVAGIWVRLDDATGAGIVTYNDKEYVTNPIGLTSIPAGTSVELTFGNGIYYSKW